MKTAPLVVALLVLPSLCFAGPIEKSVKDTGSRSHPVYLATVWEDLGLGGNAAGDECERLKEKMNAAKKNWKESKQRDEEEYRRVKKYEKRLQDEKMKTTKETWKETEKIDKDEYRRVKEYEEQYRNPRLGGSARQSSYTTQRTAKAKKKYEKAKAKYKKCLERYNEK